MLLDVTLKLFTLYFWKIFFILKKCLHDTTFKIHKQFFVALLEQIFAYEMTIITSCNNIFKDS